MERKESRRHSVLVLMDINERIEARVKELSRKLTPQELIEVINQPPDELEDLTYEIDEDE